MISHVATLKEENAWISSEHGKTKGRNSLSEAERTALPPHPAGFITLTDAELTRRRRGWHA